MPDATTIAPVYATPGRSLERSMVYPMMATAEPAIMNGALRFVLSARMAVPMVVTKLTAYKGIVSSWA